MPNNDEEVLFLCIGLAVTFIVTVILSLWASISVKMLTILITAKVIIDIIEMEKKW